VRAKLLPKTIKSRKQTIRVFSSSHIYYFSTSKMVSKASGNKKRKASPSPDIEVKKIRSSPPREEVEGHGIVNRKYYPPEITIARCQQYNRNEIPRPIEELNLAIKETASARDQIPVKDAVIHWFKNDLRTKDNHGLHLASQKAKTKGVPLICLYIISPQDYEAHITSAVRVNFNLRTLQILKEDLGKLDIPLYVETVQKRKSIPERILQLCKTWSASHLYTNIEYEVDELRRETKLVRSGLEKGISVNPVSDTCVVAPGELRTGSGGQFAVYSPWFRAWVAFLHSHPNHLKLYEPPSKNPSIARSKYKDIFESTIPEAPENRKLNADELKRYRSLWPCGEQEAHERLQKFIARRVSKYKDLRNVPSEDATSMLSIHLSAGTLSARTAIAAAKKANSTQKLDGGNQGIATWISEVAWRDFYKHVLAQWPFVW
jgi:deoxyribodipyrimidine photo-lyase